MPFGARSPAQISSAFFSKNSLHQVAIFLLSREPGGCGETASAQPSRIAAASPGTSSPSPGMPAGKTAISGRRLASALRSASRSCAEVKVEIKTDRGAADGAVDGAAKAARSDKDAAGGKGAAARGEDEKVCPTIVIEGGGFSRPASARAQTLRGLSARA